MVTCMYHFLSRIVHIAFSATKLSADLLLMEEKHSKTELPLLS
jgi:hypothetical protein